MARERRGFIVVQVWAAITYTNKDGQRRKCKKPVKALPSNSKKHLSEAEKQAAKIKHAKQIIRDTITELQQIGATNCKGSVETRILARVGHTDDQGKRHDVIRVAESRTDARDKIKEILDDLEERGGKTIAASSYVSRPRHTLRKALPETGRICRWSKNRGCALADSRPGCRECLEAILW